jgi:hypothetical protein
VTYHTKNYPGTHTHNSTAIRNVLQTLLGAGAFYGTVVALLRRDWRVIPLLLWLVVTIYLLWQQIPFHAHWLIALTPPLIALTVMGIAPITLVAKSPRTLINIATALTVVLVLFQAARNIRPIQAFYIKSNVESHSSVTKRTIRVSQDLQRLTRSNQLVITDAQFIAALADRSTPDSLVDTSKGRIATGYLTRRQLIEEASQPLVSAILFYTHRLDTVHPSFHKWVQQHFRLAHRYGKRKELWVKKTD